MEDGVQEVIGSIRIKSRAANEAETPRIGNRIGGGIGNPVFEQGYILIKGQILHDSLRGRP